MHITIAMCSAELCRAHVRPTRPAPAARHALLGTLQPPQVSLRVICVQRAEQQ